MSATGQKYITVRIPQYAPLDGSNRFTISFGPDEKTGTLHPLPAEPLIQLDDHAGPVIDVDYHKLEAQNLARKVAALNRELAEANERKEAAEISSYKLALGMEEFVKARGNDAEKLLKREIKKLEDQCSAFANESRRNKEVAKSHERLFVRHMDQLTEFSKQVVDTQNDLRHYQALHSALALKHSGYVKRHEKYVVDKEREIFELQLRVVDLKKRGANRPEMTDKVHGEIIQLRSKIRGLSNIVSGHADEVARTKKLLVEKDQQIRRLLEMLVPVDDDPDYHYADLDREAEMGIIECQTRFPNDAAYKAACELADKLWNDPDYVADMESEQSPAQASVDLHDLEAECEERMEGPRIAELSQAYDAYLEHQDKLWNSRNGVSDVASEQSPARAKPDAYDLEEEILERMQDERIAELEARFPNGADRLAAVARADREWNMLDELNEPDVSDSDTESGPQTPELLPGNDGFEYGNGARDIDGGCDLDDLLDSVDETHPKALEPIQFAPDTKTDPEDEVFGKDPEAEAAYADHENFNPMMPTADFEEPLLVPAPQTSVMKIAFDETREFVHGEDLNVRPRSDVKSYDRIRAEPLNRSAPGSTPWSHPGDGFRERGFGGRRGGRGGRRGGRRDDSDSEDRSALYFTHGISYQPASEHPSLHYRTVLISKLAEGVTYESLFSAIISRNPGQIISVNIMETTIITGHKSALIVFLNSSSAKAFVTGCSTIPLEVDHNDLYAAADKLKAEVSLIETPTYPFSPRTSKMLQDGILSRTIVVSQFPATITKMTVLEDVGMNTIQRFEQLIEYTNDTTERTLKLVFTSTEAALNAFNVLKFRLPYSGFSAQFITDAGAEAERAEYQRAREAEEIARRERTLAEDAARLEELRIAHENAPKEVVAIPTFFEPKTGKSWADEVEDENDADDEDDETVVADELPSTKLEFFSPEAAANASQLAYGAERAAAQTSSSPEPGSSSPIAASSVTTLVPSPSPSPRRQRLRGLSASRFASGNVSPPPRLQREDATLDEKAPINPDEIELDMDSE